MGRLLPAEKPALSLSDIWNEDAFTLDKMRPMIPKSAFKSLKLTVQEGAPLDVSVADSVAAAMKEWALSKVALYFAHVFYPLTNATAEKHDGFIVPQGDGTVIAEFPGKLLVQGEPDGSSFSNGGIRSTFEARGHTAWDVTSPAYIMHAGKGSTVAGRSAPIFNLSLRRRDAHYCNTTRMANLPRVRFLNVM